MALIDRHDIDGMVGRTLGRYHVVELIGEGGVGTVYRAFRDDGDGLQLQIALKVLKRGMDSRAILRRFRDERRILARLDHPNIARFLDAGVADDGRPFFVMEYLEGTPIHTWCRTQDLSARERLELFLSVCAAVEYSHRNLVIHRDLKASNILVTEDRVPKLLDFGIAKLLDRDTASAAEATQAVDRMFTPDYASPEQMRGEAITTAADIYSLGVLLYEILCDRRPFQLAGLPGPEMHRLVTETDPPRPSTVAPIERRSSLAGDLDTIVLTAMHRIAERRYASAERLADDIRRHLAGRPVRARPDTPSYRLSKFIRRNKGGVIAGCLSLVAIFGAAFTSVYQAAEAQSRDREARKRFAEIRDLASGLLGELDRSLENLPGATSAREVLARRVLAFLDSLARDRVQDVSLQRDLAAAYDRLGDILGGTKASNLGKPADALDSYRKALAILDEAARSAPKVLEIGRDRALLHSKVSDVLALTGDHTGALGEEEKALEIRLQWLNAESNDPLAKRAVAASLQELAGDLDRLGRFPEALANRQRVLEILEELDAAGYDDAGFRMALALANKRLGRSLVRAGRAHDALGKFKRAIAIERAEVANSPVSSGRRTALSYSLTDLGMALNQRNEFSKAIPLFTEALRIRVELAGADPNDWRAGSLLATTRLHLGKALLNTGESARGFGLLRLALHSREQLAERNPRNTGARGEVAEASAALADALAARSSRSGVLPLYERALTIYSDLQVRGSLTAELAGEPERIAAAVRRLRGVR